MEAITDSLVAGYGVLRTGAGLVDRSERGKLALTGAEARSVLQGQVSQDVEALTPGHGAYATFLTNKGKMLGDLRVLDAGDEVLLDTERVALQALFNLLRRGMLGYQAEMHKRTLEHALLSLVGPRARHVAGVDPGAREHDHVERDGVRWIATDVGVDALVATEHAGALRERLIAAGAVEVSEEAAEVVRVESGRPRYGVDLDDSVIPQEAGLNERAVSFTKGCYVGQETVARLFYRGKPNRRVRGLRLSDPVPSGSPLRLGERQLGRVGSSVISPRLGPIGLAIVRREADLGDVITVGDGGATATVVELPFEAGSAQEPPESIA